MDPPPTSNCRKVPMTLLLFLNSSWSAVTSQQNSEFDRKFYDGWLVTWEQVLGRVGTPREWDRDPQCWLMVTKRRLWAWKWRNFMETEGQVPLTQHTASRSSSRPQQQKYILRPFTLLISELLLILIWYDMIYLLTAFGLSPGGSSTVHIYTKTIRRTIQNKQYIEQQNNFGRVRAVPRLG